MTEPLVRPSSQRAALRIFAEPVCRHLGWFVFFLVLAPLIGPRGYGLFALAQSGIAIAEALLAGVAIRVLAGLPRVEERHLSTALVATLAAGAAMAAVLYAVSGPIVAMLDETSLGDILRSLSLLPLLGALTIVPAAQLRRQARQAPFFAAAVTGLAGGGGVAVALAWAGAGPWSLVAQIIVQRFMECAVLWLMARPGVGVAWSRRHFADLIGGLDLHALAAVWPVIARHGPCLLVGMTLGPVAAGLCMLAARFTEMAVDIALAQAPLRVALSLGGVARRAGLVAFPTVLGAALLPIAVPPLLEPRWWGAVLPAQILLLAAVPAVVAMVRAAGASNRAGEARRQALQAIGGLAVIGITVAYGLVAVAAASLAYLAAIALAGLWRCGRRGMQDQSALAAAAKPLMGALAAGLLLSVLAEPVGIALPPVPALCLLAACARLCYLVIRGLPEAAGPRLSLRRANPA